MTLIENLLRLICRNRKNASPFVIAMLSFVLIMATRVDVVKGDELHNESALSRARSLMDQDETNRTNMRAAASILEKIRVTFPEEIRIPLYLAEAYYRMADPAEEIGKTYPYFEKTGFYSQKALEMDPNRIEAHYWHGLFLLRKAQHVSIFRAYFVAKQGIAELEKVRRTMPVYDQGGASRVLGLLYAKAPGWSPFGDLDKAVRLTEEATRIAPDYALNTLYLAEVYQKRGDREAAIRECRKLLSEFFSVNPFKEKAQSILRALT
jgi:tetratricopeptide (TPR) repeat protein